MSYNSIGVGNVNITGTIEPASSYCSFNNSSYAYKPDICAPGKDLKMAYDLSIQGGTSFSTPIVTGLIALLCQEDPNLIQNPQTLKAILTSAVSANSRYLPSDSDDYVKCGSGIVDGTRSYNVIHNGQYVKYAFFAYPNNAETDAYTIQLTKGQTIRISMCYDIAQGSDSENVDDLWNIGLSLLYKTNRRVAISLNTYSNVEIIEYTAAYTGTYTIKVQHGAVPNAFSNVDYGLAWSFYD